MTYLQEGCQVIPGLPLALSDRTHQYLPLATSAVTTTTSKQVSCFQKCEKNPGQFFRTGYEPGYLYLWLYHMYIIMYIYIYVCVYVYSYIYIYMLSHDNVIPMDIPCDPIYSWVISAVATAP